MANRDASPFWSLRMVAEDDDRLSLAARHVFNRILSMRARIAADIDDVFPFSWPTVGRWLGRKKDKSRQYLLELEKAGYLHRDGVTGCPPTRQIRIVAAMASKGREKSSFKGREKSPLKGAEKSSFKGREKSPHLKYSPSDKEEIKGAQAPQRPEGAPQSSARGKNRAGSATASPDGKGLSPEAEAAFANLVAVKSALRGGNQC